MIGGQCHLIIAKQFVTHAESGLAGNIATIRLRAGNKQFLCWSGVQSDPKKLLRNWRMFTFQ